MYAAEKSGVRTGSALGDGTISPNEVIDVGDITPTLEAPFHED